MIFSQMSGKASPRSFSLVPQFFTLLHGLPCHAVETVLYKVVAARYSVAWVLDTYRGWFGDFISDEFWAH